MPVWLIARSKVRIEERGQLVSKEPGEWFQTGKMQAREFLAQGRAEIPRDDIRNDVRSLDQCGIVTPHEIDPPGDLGDILGGFEHGELCLPFEYTMLWDGVTNVNPKTIEAGFVRLMSFEGEPGAEPWEVLAELASDDLTAQNYGGEEERAETEEVIGDLRVPVYNDGVLWVRRTDATEAMVESWAEEVEAGADRQHALLRAIYTAHPMVCTLPAGWSQRFAWDGK
jgi:hypothetical protein